MIRSGDVRQESSASWTRMAITLLIAIALKQIPWSGWWLIMRPDFLLIVLLFWALHRPSRVGMAFGFALGLIGDFQDGALFGQHTAAYVLGVFAMRYFRLRFLQFDAAQQTAQLLPILLGVQSVMLLMGWLSARPPFSVNILLPALSGAGVWYLIALTTQLMHGKKAMRQ